MSNNKPSKKLIITTIIIVLFAISLYVIDAIGSRRQAQQNGETQNQSEYEEEYTKDTE